MATSESQPLGIVDLCCKYLTNPSERNSFMQENGLLKKYAHCDNCSTSMVLKVRKETICKNGQIWQCTKCSRTRSIRQNSIFLVGVYESATSIESFEKTPRLLFQRCISVIVKLLVSFQKSRLSLSNLLCIYYAFTCDFQCYHASKLFPDISDRSIKYWYAQFREMCEMGLPQKFKGEVNVGCEEIEMNDAYDQEDSLENIVEIDESLFGKKQKGNKGKKYNRYWIFGMAERATRKTRFFTVERRDMATLLPIILEHISKTATVFHDDWPVYR